MKELQGKIIIDLIERGFSFDEALERSFDEMNTFLNDLNNSEMFKDLVFNKVKNIVK